MQKSILVKYTSENEELNSYLEEGWKVITVASQFVSTSTSEVSGYFLVIIEKV